MNRRMLADHLPVDRTREEPSMYHHFYAWSEREGEFVIFRTEQDTDEARVLCFTQTLTNAIYLTDLFNREDS